MSSSTEKMRKHIDDFREYANNLIKSEVIISYDCRGKDDPFRDRLRKFLIAEYNAVQLNESTYQLGGTYTFGEIDALSDKIDNLYSEIINESKNIKEASIVNIIIPESHHFEKRELRYPQN